MSSIIISFIIFIKKTFSNIEFIEKLLGVLRDNYYFDQTVVGLD
ncbi:hypothetical protein RV07_GL003218 [Enterococcus malodoratus]|nr:hypothetical protein RV07_GL003218 [Enterococcus malodoratus]